eukprot:CAMPEP_0202482092 /NCGR_PEP_ID=MMETSP1361-20130828/1537_1 /ASSEMBLY_ACC=CAM_ASM_000849 /TAXON_ID=210615 /ORGANISM="Staurosira complex sp., Strain CCMP2646" /LENGTH=100 /DNA_ID=CAMNT_0049109831 /DNA_START=274 /DNA_END=573 /DNA_ORIENTATION=-
MSEKEQQQQEEQQRQDSVQSDAFDDDYGDDPDDFVANQKPSGNKGEQIIPRISKTVYTLPNTVASNKHNVNREIRQSQKIRRHQRKSDCESVDVDVMPKW